jgi:4-hydroxythreonine-4-phosphate dehydrogenase
MIKIGITMGDPKGIGPEIIAKAWKLISPSDRQRLRIYGDRTVLETAAQLVGTSFDPKQLAITSSVAPPIGSISDPDAARITLLALDAAIADIKNKVTSALITAPVNKLRLQLVDTTFVGHTERLARAAGVKDIVMMFSCPPHLPQHQALRISLVTSHVALKDVSSRLSVQRILVTIRLTADALKRHFDCPEPRIAVLSLNPHGGEGGALGSEETELITPAIAKARKEGITCLGPLPAEVIFAKTKDIDYDGVVAMYHDQGLTPMKITCPKKSVNMTLGLPYIRTSPGHGTAEDIAWRGNASEDGMLAALEMTEHLLKTTSPL